MSSNFTLGFNSQIFVSINGSSYTQIAQSKDLSFNSGEVGVVNITNNSSPNFSKEVAAGLNEPPKFEFDWVYTPAQQITLYGYLNAQPSQTLYWKEVFEDGSTWRATGFITKISNEAKTENEAIMGKVEIQATTFANFALS